MMKKPAGAGTKGAAVGKGPDVEGKMEPEVALVHLVPGRLRIRVRSVRGSRKISSQLQTLVESLPGILRVDARTVTGSIIVSYAAGLTTPEMILQKVKEGLEVLPKGTGAGFGNPRETRTRPSDIKREGKGHQSHWGSPTHLLGLSLFLVYALVRKFVAGSPLSQGAISLSGIVAITGGIPLAKRATLELRGGRKMGVYTLLAGACGLAIMAGEAITAVEIIWVLSIGMLLEDRAAERARRGIREILNVVPKRTLVLVEGGQVEVPVEQLKPGDVVLVSSWQGIPCDGHIIEGEALVDESRVTGRSLPEVRRVGEKVYAGTTVVEGYIRVRADRLGEETHLQRVAKLVELAIEERGTLEKRADVLASRLMRMGLLATVATLVLTWSLKRALSVLLVISCPCATVLAASTAIAAGIANAARRQILIKGGTHLEQIAQADYLCLDKTGTITEDSPSIVEVCSLEPTLSPGEVVRLAACAEMGNQHPVAKAVRAHAESMGIIPQSPSRQELNLGRGVKAQWERDVIFVGSGIFMREMGITISHLRRKEKAHLLRGCTVVYVAKNAKVVGLIALANPIRPGVREALEGLKKEGFSQRALLSGDEEAVVRAVARDLGLHQWRSCMLAEDKARFLEELTAQGRKVVMVGDGVNDALALSKATVGVALGAGGSDVAVEAGDIVLADDDLMGLVYLRRLGKRTMNTVEENFWIATGTNLAGIILGAMGLFPPVLVGLLHVAHTLGVMLNSSRLLNWRP